jgi:hypothetical protein
MKRWIRGDDGERRRSVGLLAFGWWRRKSGLFILLLVAAFGSTSEPADAAVVTTQFGFTPTSVIAYPFSVDNKGTGWFSYDNAALGTLIINSPSSHDTGYYPGIHLYMSVGDCVIYSGDVGLMMYNNYGSFGGCDAVNLIWGQYVSGEDANVGVEIGWAGPTTLWDSLPLTWFPSQDYEGFTYMHWGNVHYVSAEDGTYLRGVSFEIDYAEPSAVPEPSSLALWSGLGAIGAVMAYRRKRRAA